MKSFYLAELAIREFAIIEDLRMDWDPGFNVLTGETGAGKSIIVDALGAALGDRAAAEWVRAEAERAMVEAVFVGSPPEPLAAELEELGCLADDTVVLSRDLFRGRSLSRVNGRAVPAGSAQEVGEQIIDIHSQASHLSLLRPREHLRILDRYGGHADIREDMARLARALHAAHRELRALQEGERETLREQTLLLHEVEEIDAAGLEPGEEERLAADRSRLRHALRLRGLAAEAYAALQGEDQGLGASDLLGTALQRLEEIRSLDPQVAVDADALAVAADAADAAARALRRYVEELEEDPAALQAVEERWLTLAELKRRYGETVEEVLAYRERATARLFEIDHRAERISEVRANAAALASQAAQTAMRLSTARRGAADALEQAVARELADLGMANTIFVVAFGVRDDPAGLALDGRPGPVAFDESGVDQVEFLISANVGEAPRPLSRVASGGELARCMLAVKSTLSQVDPRPVLIFDELDQGVGGRMGHVIGEKLWGLSREHQVICITHLPQVAAYADRHWRVSKIVEGERTQVRVEDLGDPQRVDEISAMLAGPRGGPAARRSAEELLARAGEWKQAALPE